MCAGWGKGIRPSNAAWTEARGVAVGANEPVRQRELVWVHRNERVDRTARGVDGLLHGNASRERDRRTPQHESEHALQRPGRPSRARLSLSRGGIAGDKGSRGRPKFRVAQTPGARSAQRIALRQIARWKRELSRSRARLPLSPTPSAAMRFLGARRPRQVRRATGCRCGQTSKLASCSSRAEWVLPPPAHVTWTRMPPTPRQPSQV